MAGHQKSKFLQDEFGFYTTSYGPFVLRSAFQPILSQSKQGHLTIEAFEALIRPNRNGQPVSPGHFFSMVDPRDATAVDMLCRELHILNMGKLNRKDARLFINFNPALFDAIADIDAEVDHMVQVIIRAGLKPERVVCEITEQGSGENTALNRLVEGLRARQFKIAVDDYGADGSDTQRVEDLKPDILKFDAAWVRRFTETSAGMNLLNSMVKQFNDRGIITLFEGLEEDHQVEFCNQIGVQLMQGYALGRPELVPATFNDRFPEYGPEPVVPTAPVQDRDNNLLPVPGSAQPVQSYANWRNAPRRNATFGKRRT